MTRGGAAGLVVVLLAVAFGIAGFRNGRARPGMDTAAASVPGRGAAGGGETATPRSGRTSPSVSDDAASFDADQNPALTPRSTPAAPRPAVASGRDLSPDELFSQASPAVALVEVRDADMKPVAIGSGFFVSDDGLLVTNYHVIASASFASVRTGKGGTMLVEGVAAADAKADLALLKVSAKGVPFLKVARGGTPAVGTRVFAIGNPEGLTNTLSEGLISGVRSAEETGEVALIQTTAAISHGSSGGALMTGDGTVVGVTKGAIEDGQNLNFAVPAELVRKLIAGRGTLRTLASASSETLSPRDAAAYVGVLEALDRGKFEQAASLMKNLSDRQRNTPTFWFTTGCLHYKLQNLDLAEQAFKDAIKLRPDFSAAYSRLGDVYNYQNQNEKALDAYRKAVQINPKESRAYCGAGFVYGKQGEFDRAVAIFDKGIAADPKDVELLCRKGIMLGAAKRFAEAVKVYEVALKLDEKRIDTYIYVGETYMKWRKWDKAIGTYRKAIGFQPDNAMAYLNLGVAAFNAGDSKTAYYAWNNARRFDPYGPVGGSAKDYLSEPKMALRP
jgi:S1-C subfamily serine protease/cytochrome c-type biogenesis protein CcmH/NrfG